MNVLRSQVYRPFAITTPAGRDSLCDLHFYALSDGRNVCIATERNDNPGMSITNIVELGAEWASHLLRIPPETLVWIEHYVHVRDRDTEVWYEHTWDLVTFGFIQAPGLSGRWNFIDPQWRRMTDEDWNDLGIRVDGRFGGSSYG